MRRVEREDSCRQWLLRLPLGPFFASWLLHHSSSSLLIIRCLPVGICMILKCISCPQYSHLYFQYCWMPDLPLHAVVQSASPHFTAGHSVNVGADGWNHRTQYRTKHPKSLEVLEAEDTYWVSILRCKNFKVPVKILYKLFLVMVLHVTPHHHHVSHVSTY